MSTPDWRRATSSPDTAPVRSGRAPIAFGVQGALSGAVSASACSFLRLGEPNPIEIGGYCLGVKPSSYSRCQTIDGAFYLFPGLVFGLVFAVLLLRRGELRPAGAALYAVAATIANAAAVFLCVALMHPLDDLLPFDNPLLDLAVSGAIAGAAGSGLLALMFGRLGRAPWTALPVAVAAGLGALAPIMLMFDNGGVFAFYLLWQVGYAAALAFAAERVQSPAISPTA